MGFPGLENSGFGELWGSGSFRSCGQGRSLAEGVILGFQGCRAGRRDFPIRFKRGGLNLTADFGVSAAVAGSRKEIQIGVGRVFMGPNGYKHVLVDFWLGSS